MPTPNLASPDRLRLAQVTGMIAVASTLKLKFARPSLHGLGQFSAARSLEKDCWYPPSSGARARIAGHQSCYFDSWPAKLVSDALYWFLTAKQEQETNDAPSPVLPDQGLPRLAGILFQRSVKSFALHDLAWDLASWCYRSIDQCELSRPEAACLCSSLLLNVSSLGKLQERCRRTRVGRK